ncbi:MAG: 3-oxoacid CoA-transferase subunit A [Clostridia bacterium]|jgi:acetate CoA/acetoacetate CoA-transferase alpha subunit|nr:3-oxoacid CoA-transferase subunit A [Clostridia bacterium]
MKSKVIDLKEVTSLLEPGMTVMVGGFMGVGTPHCLVDLIVEKRIGELTLITNDTWIPEEGTGRIIKERLAKKLIGSHIGTNPYTGAQMNSGELEVELVPQGTLVERIRAGGFGLGGVLTPTGLGTIVEKGKTVVEVDGKKFLIEKPLRADVALIKAHKADKWGNLVFRHAARNFNPIMATAATTVIVEAEKICEVGDIDPNTVMLPGVFVDYIVKGEARWTRGSA